MKSLLCLLGRHDWAERANDDGERYRACRRCGAIADDPLPGDFGVLGPPG